MRAEGERVATGGFTNVPYDAQRGSAGYCGLHHKVYTGISCPICTTTPQLALQPPLARDPEWEVQDGC